MKKNILVLLCLVFVFGGFKPLHGMKKKIAAVLRKMRSKKSVIIEVMKKRDSKKIVEMLEKYQNLSITKEILQKSAWRGSGSIVTFLGHDSSIWNEGGIFTLYDFDTTKKIITHMNADTVLDPWTMKAVICSGDPEVLEFFLKKYKELGGDVTKRYKRFFWEWGWGDFIVAASWTKNSCRAVFSADCAKEMLKLFFKNGLSAHERVKRTVSLTEKRNLFEEYFEIKKYNDVIADKLLSENSTVGSAAKLLSSIQSDSWVNIKLWSQKIGHAYLGKQFFIKGIGSPIEFAMKMGKRDICSYLLDRYVFSDKSNEDVKRILNKSVKCGFIGLADMLIDGGAQVTGEVLSNILSSHTVCDTTFGHKAIKNYKYFGGAFNQDHYKAIFNFALQRVNNENLINFLKKNSVLSSTVVFLLKGPVSNLKFKDAIKYLKDEDRVNIAAFAISSVKVQMLKNLEAMGVNMNQAVALLRNRNKHEASTLKEEPLKKEELAKIYKEKYSFEAHEGKINSILKIVNPVLEKHNKRGFSDMGSYDLEKLKTISDIVVKVKKLSKDTT